MEFNEAIRQLLSAGSLTTRPPPPVLPKSSSSSTKTPKKSKKQPASEDIVGQLTETFACLRVELWSSILAHLSDTPLTSKSAKRAGSELLYTFRTISRICCQENVSEHPELVRHLSLLLRVLAELMEKAAGVDKAGREAASVEYALLLPAGVQAILRKLEPATSGAGQDDALPDDNEDSAAELHSTDRTSRLLQRIDDLAALLCLAVSVVVEMPSSVHGALSAGSSSSPAIALLTACLRAFSHSCAMFTNSRRLFTLFVSSECTKLLEGSKLQGKPLLIVLLVARDFLLSSERNALVPTSIDADLEAMKDSIASSCFSAESMSGYASSFRQSSLFMQASAVVYRHAPTSGAKRQRNEAEATRDTSIIKLLVPRSLTLESKLFAVIDAELSASDNQFIQLPVIRSLPLLLAIFSDRARYLPDNGRLQEADAKRKPATGAKRSRERTSDESANVCEAAAISASRQPAFAFFVELVAALSSFNSLIDEDTIRVTLDASDSQFWPCTRTKADAAQLARLQCVASLLQHVVGNGLYDMHRDASYDVPVQQATLYTIGQYVSNALRAGVHADAHAMMLEFSHALASSAACLMELNYASIGKNVSSVIQQQLTLASGSQPARAHVERFLTHFVYTQSKLRTVSDLFQVYCELTDGQYQADLDAVMLHPRHMGAIGAAFRSLPAGQVGIIGNLLVDKFLALAAGSLPSLSITGSKLPSNTKVLLAPQWRLMGVFAVFIAEYLRQHSLSVVSVEESAKLVLRVAESVIPALKKSWPFIERDAVINQRHFSNTLGVLVASTLDAMLACLPYERAARLLPSMHDMVTASCDAGEDSTWPLATPSVATAAAPYLPLTALVALLPAQTDISSALHGCFQLLEARLRVAHMLLQRYGSSNHELKRICSEASAVILKHYVSWAPSSLSVIGQHADDSTLSSYLENVISSPELSFASSILADAQLVDDDRLVGALAAATEAILRTGIVRATKGDKKLQKTCQMIMASSSKLEMIQATASAVGAFATPDAPANEAEASQWFILHRLLTLLPASLAQKMQENSNLSSMYMLLLCVTAKQGCTETLDGLCRSLQLAAKFGQLDANWVQASLSICETMSYAYAGKRRFVTLVASLCAAGLEQTPSFAAAAKLTNDALVDNTNGTLMLSALALAYNCVVTSENLKAQSITDTLKHMVTTGLALLPAKRRQWNTQHIDVLGSLLTLAGRLVAYSKDSTFLPDSITKQVKIAHEVMASSAVDATHAVTIATFLGRLAAAFRDFASKSLFQHICVSADSLTLLQATVFKVPVAAHEVVAPHPLLLFVPVSVFEEHFNVVTIDSTGAGPTCLRALLVAMAQCPSRTDFPEDYICSTSSAARTALLAVLRELLPNLVSVATHTPSDAQAVAALGCIREIVMNPSVVPLRSDEFTLLLQCCILQPQSRESFTHSSPSPDNASTLSGSAWLLHSMLKYRPEDAMASLPSVYASLEDVLARIVNACADSKSESLISVFSRVLEQFGRSIRTVRYYAVHLLASLLVLLATPSPGSSGSLLKISAEVREALQPGIFSLFDACTAKELQQLHIALSHEHLARTLLKSMHQLYDSQFRYTGKV